MSNISFEDLYSEFLKIMEAGDEQATKNFLIDHIKEFPEDTQKEIVTAFVADALEKRKDSAEAMVAFQKEALATFSQLETAKQDVADKLKLLDIKESA